MLKGFFFSPIAAGSNKAKLVISCINSQCFFDVSSSSCAYGNCRIAVKKVFAVSNIACVFRICFKVAGNSSGKSGFRFRHIGIITLAVFLAEGDITGF